MRKNFLLALFGLGALAAGGPVEAQTTDGAFGIHRGFSLELSVANVGIDQFDVNREAIGLRPRWCPFRRGCLFIDICWIPRPWPDPWVNRPLGIPGELLEVGPGLQVAPAFEFHFSPESRLRPALYLGAGVSRIEGQTLDLGERGRFRTEADTSPLVMYGGSLAYDLTPKTTFRFQAGASTTFIDELKVSGPNGQAATADGRDITSPIVGVSLSYSFGR